MKKRFQNILERSVKRKGILPLSCAAILSICLSLLIGCAREEESDVGMLRHEEVFIETQTPEDPGTASQPLNNGDNAGLQNTGTETVPADDAADAPQQESDAADNAEGTGNAAAGEQITMTFMMEGVPEEQTATLFWGDGYSIYVPDEDWRQYDDDAWMSAYNDTIRFWISRYEGQSVEEVQQELRNSDGLKDLVPDDQEPAVRGELIQQTDNMITHVRLVEHGADVWSICYCYPAEAIEGAGARLPVIVDSFALSETDPETGAVIRQP